MKIITCFKVVPEEQDIAIKADGELSFDRAKPTISAYDLNGVEAGAQLLEECGGELIALSAGAGSIDSPKLKKNILSRGPGSLAMVADDRLQGLDTHQTAEVLKAAIEKIGEYDLILCGEGSSDLYAQQVGPQLGQLLNIPAINAISKITAADGKIVVQRTLENEVETLEITLPALVTVTTDINLPRIATMNHILAAGKKPSTVWALEDIGIPEPPRTIEVIDTRAPRQVERKQDIVEGDTDDAIQEFISKLSAVLAK
jgi:electron transfer flavoprotein beta subunit